MKQRNHHRQTAFSIACIALLTMAGHQVFAAQRQPLQGIQQETRKPAASSTMQHGTCGPEMEFDRNSGRMVRKNRVDLVVTRVEMTRIEGGRVAIKPAIKNRCPGGIDRNVSVSIEDVVISFGPPPPNTPVTTTAVILGVKDSYRVTVDSNNQVNEIVEHNNVCTARFPRSMASHSYPCP